ncbi:uncharacterized protein TNCV_1928791 [Trichonephila clavipes]|nr:uncharacterized protein TNCV_1928791 [Trichonephila clavipes]
MSEFVPSTTKDLSCRGAMHAIHQNDHQARRRSVELAQNEITVVPDFHKRILFSDEAHFWLNGYVNKQNCRIWSEANPQVYVETPLHPEKLNVWSCASNKTRNMSHSLCYNRFISLVYVDKPQTLDHLEDNIRRVIADIRPQMLEKVIENWTSRLDYIRDSRGSPMPEIIFKIIYQINHNVTVIESFVFNQARTAGALRESYWMRIVGRLFITNEQSVLKGLRFKWCKELWFQQDGASCHIACSTIDLLKDTFGDCLISRFGPVNWRPRSCDLTPLDYFLWGYVNSLVYADKPQTLHHLEDNIRRVIADIRPQMLEKVIENWTFRLDYIRVSRGSPMPEIIFKM